MRSISSCYCWSSPRPAFAECSHWTCSGTAITLTSSHMPLVCTQGYHQERLCQMPWEYPHSGSISLTYQSGGPVKRNNEFALMWLVLVNLDLSICHYCPATPANIEEYAHALIVDSDSYKWHESVLAEHFTNSKEEVVQDSVCVTLVTLVCPKSWFLFWFCWCCNL